MADYISREAAVEWFAAFAHIGEESIPTETVLGDLKGAIPAADVKPVVRCRECVHFDPEDEDGLCCADTGAMLCPDENDYCSCGQRKDQSAQVRKKEGIPDAAKETT